MATIVAELHDEANIDCVGYEPHGLRHTVGVELCLADATDTQGAAWPGHSSPHSLSTSRRQASRLLLAASARDLLKELRTTPSERFPNRKFKPACKRVRRTSLRG